jgi:hypothetical protein
MPDMGMMIFRLIASPPKRVQLLLFGIPPCVCKRVSEVMYQQAASVVHRLLLRIPYTSLYGWRNNNDILFRLVASQKVLRMGLRPGLLVRGACSRIWRCVTVNLSMECSFPAGDSAITMLLYHSTRTSGSNVSR